ncbi:MAG: hypothetical protein K6A38_07525 [Lachnospiraceae bacterium]|nr:hypothetical protein [Lachnospiraceae bacterium]
MKFRKFIVMMLMSLCIVGLGTGCSSIKELSSDKKESSKEEDEEGEEEEEEKESKKKKKKKDKDKDEDEEEDKKEKKSKEQVFESEPEESSYEYDEGEIYYTTTKAVLREDGTASFMYVYEYPSENSVSTNEYLGTYEWQGDDTFEVYVTSYGNVETRRITVEGDKITNVEYLNGNVAEEIAGTYTCDSTEAGADNTLEIYADGSAYLLADDKEYSGYVYAIDDKWNVCVSNNEYVESYDDYVGFDWVCDFDGGTFDYVSYAYYIYADYEQEMKAFGDLGEVTFKFDDVGNCTTSVKIDGKTRNFEGSYYVNKDEERIESAYVQDEDGNTLNLNFGEVDGQMNYFGEYTKALGAG